MLRTETYIPDGYELDGYIAAAKGVHGPVRFKYRPMTIDERDEVRELIQGSKSKDYNPVIRAALAEHLKGWDVKPPGAKPDAAPVPITIGSIRGLLPQVFDKMFFIVCGDRPSDIPDDGTPKEESGYVERMRQAANGESLEAAAVKN